MPRGFADRRRSHGRRVREAGRCGRSARTKVLLRDVGEAGAVVSDKGLVAGSLNPLDHGPALHLRMDLPMPRVQRKRAVSLVGGRTRISFPPGRPRTPRPLSSCSPRLA